MPIDATQRKNMKVGLTLVATYKKAEHTAAVIVGAEDKLLYRLSDGRDFKSPSAAGSAVMGGVACNGWRFWSVATGEAAAKPKVDAKTAKPKAPAKPKASAKSKATGATKKKDAVGPADAPTAEVETPAAAETTPTAGPDALALLANRGEA